MDFSFIPMFALILSFISLLISTKLSFDKKKNESIHIEKFISERLYEFDKIIISRPDLQKKLFDIENNREFVFTHPLSEPDITLKSYIYLQINFFDELCCILKNDNNLSELINSKKWLAYIKWKMSNPAFAFIYNQEKKVFWGQNLEDYLSLKDIEIDELIKDYKNIEGIW